MMRLLMIPSPMSCYVNKRHRYYIQQRQASYKMRAVPSALNNRLVAQPSIFLSLGVSVQAQQRGGSSTQSRRQRWRVDIGLF